MENNNDNLDAIDLEEYSKSGREIPKNGIYRFKVNEEKFVTDQECLLAEEILKIAEFDTGENFLFKKNQGKSFDVLCSTDKVDFTEPGLEKFKTQVVGNNLLLIILTTQGKWKVVIPGDKTVQDLINLIIEHFHFSAKGQYELRLKTDPNKALNPSLKLNSLSLNQCASIIFTDLGMAA